MDFLEKDLEDIIYTAYNQEMGMYYLADRGIDLRGTMFRQLNLGAYGKADLVTMDFDYPEHDTFHVNVIELKKDFVDTKTLSQACRYVTALKRYFESNEKFFDFNIEFKVTLIGRSISTNDDFLFLYNECSSFCEVYLYSYKIDGIYFKYIEPIFICNNENLNEIERSIAFDFDNYTVNQI